MNVYRLLKKHKRNGIELPAGALIPLNDRQADWLAEQGVIAKSGIVARATSMPVPVVKPARRVGGCRGCGR
jgi:hypothetical protein